MKKSLINRIYTEGIVDTKNFRYVLRDEGIYRLPISALDTTSASHCWELVKAH